MLNDKKCKRSCALVFAPLVSEAVGEPMHWAVEPKSERTLPKSLSPKRAQQGLRPLGADLVDVGQHQCVTLAF